jgi:hypothetical protein
VADLDEVLRIVVLGLEWFALWLEDSPLRVAWPLFFVLVFQVSSSPFTGSNGSHEACSYPSPATTQRPPPEEGHPARIGHSENGTGAISIAAAGAGGPIAIKSTRSFLDG